MILHYSEAISHESAVLLALRCMPLLEVDVHVSIILGFPFLCFSATTMTLL